MFTFTQYAQNACKNIKQTSMEECGKHIMHGPTVALTVFVSSVEEQQIQPHRVFVYISKFRNCYNSFG